MTSDRRELILDRVYNLLSELTIPIRGDEANGPTSLVAGNIVRNQHDLPAEAVPGIILLDADEVRSQRQTRPERGMKENGVPDSIIRMTPEIYVVLDTRSVTNVNNVGSGIWMLRGLRSWERFFPILRFKASWATTC